MELITNILIEYLKHNKRIVVPKLGVFIVKQPSGNIIFSDLMRNDDGALRSLLIAYGIKELEANGMIDRFVFEIRHAISRGESFNIEGLGEFCPAENNTIKFKQRRDPIVIGGNIKPPVEILNTQRAKLQSRGGTSPQSTSKQRGGASQQNKERGAEAQNSISTARPDDYLRGLKYDKNKNRKRSEEMSDNRGRSTLNSVVIVLLIAIVAFGIVWGIWQWTKGDISIPTREVSRQQQSITSADTTNRAKADTLIYRTDSLSIGFGLSDISVTE